MPDCVESLREIQGNDVDIGISKENRDNRDNRDS